MDPQRKALRFPRRLTFEAGEAFRGEVTNISATGMKVVSKASKVIAPSEVLFEGVLTLETQAHVKLKVRVARVKPLANRLELGLEIAEADKGFYDALPMLTRPSIPKR